MIKKLFILSLTLWTGFNTISAEEGRPKIGLVLGGGGALGFAHIGVIQELEKMQIPIDYIGGTSMGAIVAGMYASGMSPQEMEHSFTQLDWWDVLKDQSPHQYLVYRRKQDDKRFVGAELGFNDWTLRFRPGMAYGQKLNNVIETFALNSTGITDFDQLNIPYRAVASDLRKGESVVLKSGNLALAMRASMAVPGAFTPVRMGDQIFVDGGIFNNMPVDVVKSMGADIIIAVDVGASGVAKSEKNDFQSLPEVIGRTYTIMQRPGQEEQLKNANIVIQPDLQNFSPSHFHRSSEIIPEGRSSTLNNRKKLQRLVVSREAYAAFLKKQRAKHETSIIINDIKIEGNRKVSTGSVRYRVKAKKGPLNLDTVNRDLRRIYGMGDFQTVSYDLEPNGDDYALVYNAQEKYWGPGFLHLGMKFEMGSDTSMLWSILLNYTRTLINQRGGEIRVDLEGGGYRRGVHTEWYQPINNSGRFFVAPAITALDEDINFYQGDTVFAEVEQQRVFGNLDIGISGFEFGEFRVGILGGRAWDEGRSGLISLGEINDNVVGVKTRLVIDQLDDVFFPSKGFQLMLDGLFSNEQLGSDRSYDRVDGKAVFPVTFGRHTLISSISGGSSFGTDLPFYSAFFLGGMDSFAGYAPYQILGNYYGLCSLGYRYRIGRLPPTLGDGIFASARFDAGNAWLDKGDVKIKNLEYGALIGIGTDTVIGRISLSVGKAHELKNVRFYMSIGNTF